MFNLELLMTGVFAVSVATGLTTEAIKKLAGECKWNWNLVSCIVTVVLAVGISVGYIINNDLAFNAQLVISVIAFTYASWLAAMLGYDKIKQAFGNIKNPQ